MLPADWRERLVAQVIGGAPADGELFGGGPVLGPQAQIEVYRRQYRLRLGDAVREELAGLAALAPEAIEAWIPAYLADHPSQSWTLNRVADRFEGWLAAQPRLPEGALDMARLDRAVNDGFEAAEVAPIRPEAIGSGLRLALPPSVRLLRFGWSVHRFRAQALADEAPDPLEAGDFPVVVFRVERRMRHLQMHPVAWSLLGRVGAGEPLGDAIGAVVAEGAPVSLLQASLQGWFAFYVEHGLLCEATQVPQGL